MGVFLHRRGKPARQGLAALEALRVFEACGVRYILFTTWLDCFGLTEKVRVGIPGGWGTSWRGFGLPVAC